MSATQTRYRRVNKTWPDTDAAAGYPALPPLTPQEAISAVKRLYRQGMGKAFKGDFKPTSGNRNTWVRGGIFYVNADQGWRHLVHDLSHFMHYRLHPTKGPHDWRHAALERDLIATVVGKGWLEGTLRRPEKPREDIRVRRYKRLLTRISAWEAKKKRAEKALKKLARQAAYYAKTLESPAS